MADFSIAHECVILDADCIISLAASGKLAEILAALPCPGYICRYVNEAEVLREDLRSCITSGVLTVVSPEGIEYETILRITIEAELGDGESETAAIAAHRNWAIAIDDRKARNYFKRAFPKLQLLSTPELLRHWVEISKPTGQEIKGALERVRMIGRYQIGTNHELFLWWQAQLA